jgi:hypothetical protein
VLAIVAVIAAVLFPVFSAARSAAQKTSCISHFRNVSFATALYLNDYDDRYMPVNHQPGGRADSRNDRTWVQILLPYVRSFSLFRCSADSTMRPHTEAIFDEDLVPGDTTTQYYRASMRSNLGYNYHYLAPIVRSSRGWEARPRFASEIIETSRTLIYVDSVWSREGGVPTGGGSWLVVPPCRYTVAANGVWLDSFTGFASGSVEVYTTSEGWNIGDEASALQYGGAWPWHAGHMNVAQADGSVVSRSPGQLAQGCDLRPEWPGRIRDNGEYMWDAR